MLVGRQSSYIVLAIVYERQSWQTKDKRPQRSNVNVKNLWQNSQYLWNIVFSVLEEVFEFCWSSLADEHNTTKIDQRRHKIGQIYIWNPMTTGFIMQTLICVISMEFLPLSRRRSSLRNVPSYEERGETDVFAGYCVIMTNNVHGILRFLYLFHLLYGICVKIFIMNRYISKSYTTSKNSIDWLYRAGAAVESTIIYRNDFNLCKWPSRHTFYAIFDSFQICSFFCRFFDGTITISS